MNPEYINSFIDGYANFAIAFLLFGVIGMIFLAVKLEKENDNDRNY